MRSKFAGRPSPGTCVAVASLMLAATPIADAATSKQHASKRPPVPVNHARFADNAGRVGGYRASFFPQPNTLVPLGPDGRLPASVLPRGFSAGDGNGTAGPPGPAGPSGVSGLDAPGVVTIVFQADGTSSNPSGGAAEAICPVGTKVLGAGFNDLTRTVPALASALGPGSVDEVAENDPFARNDGRSGWRVRITNVQSVGMLSKDGTSVVPNTLPAGSTYFQSYAICG